MVGLGLDDPAGQQFAVPHADQQLPDQRA
jgi:hypothetical protein